MEIERIKELQFLMRTGSPIPVTDSRKAEVFQTSYYSDFYTIQELISQGFLEYIGHQKAMLCLRPLSSFTVYISGDLRDLKASEIVIMSLTTPGRNEFEQWLAETKE